LFNGIPSVICKKNGDTVRLRCRHITEEILYVVLNEFLRKFFIFIEPVLSNKGQGSTFYAINRNEIINLLIKLPPLSEQRKIVEILDQADELRRKRKEADEKAGKILQALFYKMFGDPTVNSMGWELIELGNPDVCEINPRLKRNGLDEDSIVSFIPMADIEEKYGRIIGTQTRPYSQVKKGFTYFENNDVLFAKITPCMQNGKAAIAYDLINGTGFGSTEFHVLRPKKKSTSAWLFSLVRLPYFRKLAEQNFTGSVGQQRVPSDFIKNFKVGCPPIDLQIQFEKIFNNTFSRIEKCESARIKNDKEIEVLVHHAFTGQLTSGYRERNKTKLEAELAEQLKAIEEANKTKSQNQKKTTVKKVSKKKG